MKIFTISNSKRFLLAAIACGMSYSASAIQPITGNFDLTNYRYQNDSRSIFSGTRQARINKINSMMPANENAPARLNTSSKAAEAVSPAVQLGPSNYVGDLDAPGGELWFYTSNLTYEEIPPHDDIAYTDRILREYEFTIYDAQFNVVGVVKDQMDYRENEVRSPMCELAPVVTRNFFNDSDDIEIFVGLAANISGGGNNYRTIAYSIGGAKDEQGYDEPIYTFESLIGDVIEGPRAADGKDNFYITFAEDIDAPADTDFDTFWEYVCSQKVKFEIYGSARGEDAPRQLFEKEIRLLTLPGDQQNSPFVVSKSHNGNVYFIQAEYDEPFYNEYNDITEDITMRPDNKLIVNFYQAEGSSVTLAHTTTIDIAKDSEDEVLASYYGIGKMRYREDFDFDNYGTPEGKAAIIVTKENYMVGNDDAYITSFYVYGADGSRILTLFENCESTLTLSDIEGQEPQMIFITTGGYNYEFTGINLHSGKRAFRFTNDFYIEEIDDTELLLANIDRIPMGDTYKYAVEMRYPTVDDNDNDIMRIMWLDSKANYDHIDYVNMGKNVFYATCHISQKTLDPTFYHSDDNYEYLILVKRSISESASNEELILGQAISEEKPEGETLLTVVPDATLGSLSHIIPMPSADNESNRLLIGFYNSNTLKYTSQFYDLPLDSTNGSGGINEVIFDGVKESNIVINGNIIEAEGFIEIYTATGYRALCGFNTVDTTNLSTGLYIIKAGNAAHKLIIR
ncbi:MAG: hypothetical protein K2L84_10030 [Muribaculaceae bacterium]|nr:hypothetical protein [Muribaculaceae bacterium]